MNPVICPCCRATNTAGPTCRRCKADLSLLLALAARREFLLAAARKFAGSGKFADAQRSLEQAAALQAGDDTRQLQAAVFLLAGDYPAALAAYDALLARSSRDE